MLLLHFEGTADFLQTNPTFTEDQSLIEETACNKDTGGLKAFHSWSRGLFFIVSAGGHIEYWQPLYRFVLVSSFTNSIFLYKLHMSHMTYHSMHIHYCTFYDWH